MQKESFMNKLQKKPCTSGNTKKSYGLAAASHRYTSRQSPAAELQALLVRNRILYWRGLRSQSSGLLGKFVFRRRILKHTSVSRARGTEINRL